MKLIRDPADGKYLRDPADGKMIGGADAGQPCACCGDTLTCDDFALVTEILRNGPQHTGFPNSNNNQERCHRLFVWANRTVTSGVYGGNQAHDYILKTTQFGYRAGVLPFETAPGSGVLLDSTPYWWACAGGWATVGSMHYEPTLSQIVGTTLYAPPSTDGTFSLCAIVKYNHWQEKVADGGTELVAVTDGQVKVLSVQHVQHT